MNKQYRLFITCLSFVVICSLMSMHMKVSASAMTETTQHMPGIEWGQEQGMETLLVGWGCPLHAPIVNITSGMSGTMLGWLNFFFPISELAAILFVWVIAIGAYYIASVALRWKRAIS